MTKTTYTNESQEKDKTLTELVEENFIRYYRNKIKKEDNSTMENSYGWICKKCGRSLSPSTTECPCNYLSSYGGYSVT